MAKSESHHVVPNPDGGWDLKKAGSSRTSGHFDTQQDAIDRGREVSANQNTELFIHARDGQI
jgi:uncharacterized protein YdaT